MRLLTGLICCAALAAGDVTQLRQLADKKLMFQLRETLQRPGSNESVLLLYRGLTASRFGQEPDGIKHLRKFLATHPARELEQEAYEELASAQLRLGHYGETARALAEALRRMRENDDDRADTENDHRLYESLKDVPPPTVKFGQDTPVEAKFNAIGSWNVPLEVNGRAAEWIFDTGANLSTLTESEAARIGLQVRESTAYVKGSTDVKNAVRLAVAPDLRFGRARLKNVVFLVIPDESLYIGPLKYQIRGILGFPVLRALGQVGISAQGQVRIGGSESSAGGSPNLFFDDLRPILELRHGDHRLEMFVDTGANASSGYPSFRAALTKDEIAKLKTQHDQTGGAGGAVTRTVEIASTTRLEILSRPADLKQLTLLRTEPAAKSRYLDGVIGMDALLGGFTLDFRAMQLRLE
jgi:aspartyl protease